MQLPKISRRQALHSMAAAWAGLLSQAALASDYPSRPIKLVVPVPPGGGPDIAARILAEKLSQRLKQPVVVDNRPGAGTLLGAGVVAKAPADGHTLLLTPNTLVISPHVLPAGAAGGLLVQRDLLPVMAPATTPLVLLAHPKLGVKNLPEALALMRRDPSLTYGSAGNGSPMHFAGEMLKRSARVELLHVPYRGVAPSITATLGGEVQFLFTVLGGAVPYIQSGQLTALALTEQTRSELLPALPTATEQGLPGVEVGAWYGIFAPPGTPTEVVARLNQELQAILRLPDVRQKFATAGTNAIGGSTEQLTSWVKADDLRYGALARELNIRAD